MKMLKKLFNDDSPAWLKTFLGGIGATLLLALGSILTLITQNYVMDRTERREALKQFEIVSYDLEPLGQNYIRAELNQDPAAIEENREVLLENIAKQVAAAERLKPYIKDDQVIFEYTESVVNLRKALAENYRIEDMKPYWEAKQEVLVARKAIVDLNN